ncbi:hypothetical protein ASD40_11305 [Paenibacillus sp. Root444D2]|nr:hypothetical protein ASD40_11305 [Paenibacillus sp. Root444D2]KRE36370.1 hypothetical protein ASG85_09330 [Paenibacillus sp. Soil724D2]
MNTRIEQLVAYMDRRAIDAVLITMPKHVYYLTGFASDPHERLLGLLIPRGAEPLLIVPALDLVLAGEKSALPHGVPGSQAVREGELLLCDRGSSVFTCLYLSSILESALVDEFVVNRRSNRRGRGIRSELASVVYFSNG